MPFCDKLRHDPDTEKLLTPVFIPRPIPNAVSHTQDAKPKPIQGLRTGRKTPLPQWINAGNGKAPVDSPQHRLCQIFGI